MADESPSVRTLWKVITAPGWGALEARVALPTAVRPYDRPRQLSFAATCTYARDEDVTILLVAQRGDWRPVHRLARPLVVLLLCQTDSKAPRYALSKNVIVYASRRFPRPGSGMSPYVIIGHWRIFVLRSAQPRFVDSDGSTSPSLSGRTYVRTSPRSWI